MTGRPAPVRQPRLTRFGDTAPQISQPPDVHRCRRLAAKPSGITGRERRRAGGKDFATGRPLMRTAAARLLVVALVAAAGATALGQSSPATIGGAAAAALPGRQLVEPGHERRAARARVGGAHRLHQQRRIAAAASRLRRLLGRGSGHLRHSLRRRRRRPAEAPGAVLLPGARAIGNGECRSTRFPIRPSRSRRGSRAAHRATRPPAAIATC